MGGIKYKSFPPRLQLCLYNSMVPFANFKVRNLST
jgi:hypothetical protein